MDRSNERRNGKRLIGETLWIRPENSYANTQCKNRSKLD
jgi:hypothetical protein